jgi:hypothetical protein
LAILARGGINMDLIQLWQSINTEATHLAETVERLPDACDCHDADAHLAGRCACCTKNEGSVGFNQEAESCDEILARLRADLTMLSEDLALAGPPMDAAALEKGRFELRRGVFLAGNDLQQILAAFKRLTESVAGFRRDCALSRLQAVKRYCKEFRDHCERVNAEMSSLGEQQPDAERAMTRLAPERRRPL